MSELTRNTNPPSLQLQQTPPQSIWIVAGEESGDSRAAELMQELKSRLPAIRFHGAGGPKMAALAEKPFDNWIAEAGVLGLWDVLKRYPYFHKKFNECLDQIDRQRPTAVILVDYPGFNLRLAKALRKRKIPLKIIYYISPQVWAWNRRRIPIMARLLDLMICIFPFEKPLYESSGLQTEYVGHPLIDSLKAENISLPREENLIGFFPGSREREIKRLFPVMLEAAAIIQRSYPDIRFEAAASNPQHADWMRAKVAEKDLPCIVTSGKAHELMQRATIGIVCSGTATLEAAFFGLPYCLVYKIAWLTFEVGKRLVKVKFLGIVNILAGQLVVREFIQHFCTPTALADEAFRLLNSKHTRVMLQNQLAQTVAQLGEGGAAAQAADAIRSRLQA